MEGPQCGTERKSADKGQGCVWQCQPGKRPCTILGRLAGKIGEERLAPYPRRPDGKQSGPQPYAAASRVAHVVAYDHRSMRRNDKDEIVVQAESEAGGKRITEGAAQTATTQYRQETERAQQCTQHQQ